MKILLATGIYPPEIGGPATYASLLSQELPKRGIDVVVLPFSEVRKYPKIIRHIVYFFKVLRHSSGVRAIFTQDPISTGLPVICASFVARKKVIMRVAGDYVWEQARQRFGVSDSIDEFQTKKYSLRVELLRLIQSFTVCHANLVIVPSEYFNKVVTGWIKGKKKPVTIYNGIDLDFSFERGDKYIDQTIITAGRLVQWKGFDTLILALESLPDWQLIIAGDGPDRSRLMQLIEAKKLNDRVTLLGNVTRAELFAKIYRSQIFALLSKFESFSFQIVETMNIGTPVIAGNIGNISEIIENGNQGILIDPDDIDEFAKAVNKISSDITSSGEMIANARERAKYFSKDRTIDAVSSMIKDIGI